MVVPNRIRMLALGALVSLLTTWAFTHVATAQSENWDDVVAAARKEGEVIVWGQAGDQFRKFWKDAFEQAYPGITVRLFQASNSSERSTRFLREYQAGVLKVDVIVSGSAGIIDRLKPSHAIQPLRPFLRPEILDGKNWLNGTPVWVDSEKQYVMIADQSVGTAAIANSSIKEDEIKTWDDFLSPKYDRKIIALDPRQSGQNYAFSLFLYSSPDLGPSFLEKFYKGGRVVFSTDQRQMADWVDSGRMLIGFGMREAEIASLLKVGSNIRVFTAPLAGGVPQTIVVGSPSALAIPNLNPLPHPNAARVYANWMFSREGQQAMVDTNELFSTRVDVDQSKISARLKQIPGAKYTDVNAEALAGEAATKALRDIVTKALEEH